MQCLFCDEPIGQNEVQKGQTCPEVYRIQTGGVTWKKWGLQFVSELFEDEEKLKWVCKSCVAEHCAFPEMLSLNCCAVCQQEFDPIESGASDCVLLMESGLLYPSSKGPFVTFRPQLGGYVHFTCACDELNLPLWNLDRVA